MLIIKTSPAYERELNYAFETVINYIMGLDYKIKYEDRDDIEIIINESDKKLFVSNVFFKNSQWDWLKPSSLPKQPLPKWIVDNKLKEQAKLVSNEIPVIYGCETAPGSYMRIDDNSIHLGIDIFCSAFFMLTRYEEYVKPERDQHDRFPATASLAYKEGFLDRPVINEYLEILWYCIKRLWPGLERKKRNFRTILTHDVDVPFNHAFTGLPQLIRSCGGDLLKRRDLFLAVRRAKSWQAVKRGDYRQDISYTFDRIMDISEKNSLKSAFYFKTACTDPNYDHNYSIEHKWIRQLLRDIYQRGHEIGIHPSYNTYQDNKQIKLEFERLLKVCEEEGIKQETWGGRQHYLRWKTPLTWRIWNEAGIDYDSTLSYANHAGFRCGICYEFPVYDLEQRQKLRLVERPLIVMEGSVLGEQYMNLEYEDALQYMKKLKERCKRYAGDFVLLWHNSSFATKKDYDLYEFLVGA